MPKQSGDDVEPWADHQETTGPNPVMGRGSLTHPGNDLDSMGIVEAYWGASSSRMACQRTRLSMAS